MPRYSQAYSGLIIRFEEIDVLLRLARSLSNSRPIHSTLIQINAICRGGVVLLSSHIEGYIEELGETAITNIGTRGIPKSKLSGSFKYHLSRDLIKSVKDASNPIKVAEHVDSLQRRDAHIWDTSPNFTSQLTPMVFLSNFSNPTHDKIKKFFARFGYHKFEGDLGQRLRADYIPCRNMLDQVIEQRNRIAHGDTISIGTPTDLADMFRLAKKYCRETDCVVGDWFRSIGCVIR